MKTYPQHLIDQLKTDSYPLTETGICAIKKCILDYSVDEIQLDILIGYLIADKLSYFYNETEETVERQHNLFGV